MGWVVGLEGVGGGGGDETGRLHSELTVHCEQQELTTDLQIYNSVKRCESQQSFRRSEAGLSNSWTELLFPLSRGKKTHSCRLEQPEDVCSEGVRSDGTQLDMSRSVGNFTLKRGNFIGI